MYLLPILNLIMLMGVIGVIILIILKKRRIAATVFSIVVLYFGLNFFFFETSPGKNYLHLHPLFWGKKIDVPQAASINIDGILYESCWQLENHEFYLDTGQKTSRTPSIQFLRDNENLYLGVCYEAENDIEFHENEEHLPDFGITLTSLTGDSDRKVRLLFEPFDNSGNACGRSFCDCPKTKAPTVYKFASRTIDNKWTFEFSTPIDEVMGPDDMNLFFRIRFSDKNISGTHICSYPNRNDNWSKYLKISR